MKIFQRNLYPLLHKSLQEPWVDVIIGARQIGKTTLMQQLIHSLPQQGIPEKNIILLNLDNPELRMEITKKPSYFFTLIEECFRQPLSQLQGRHFIFLDEAQKLPLIFDLIKILYDEHRTQLKIILSGSSSLTLQQSTAETLAGRSRFWRLSPLTWSEILKNHFSLDCPSFIQEFWSNGFSRERYLQCVSELSRNKEEVFFLWRKYLTQGGLPLAFLLEESEARSRWFGAYLENYLERDIRGLASVGDEHLFLSALKTILFRDASLLNLANLSAEIDIQRATLKKYLYVLQETFLVQLLYPFVRPPKISVKSPKLYFFDHGLVNYTRHVSSWEQLEAGQLLGKVFESTIARNLLWTFHNDPQTPDIHFWRNYQDYEIDLVVATPQRVLPIEVTFSEKLPRNKFKNFESFYKIFPKAQDGFLVWKGEYELFTLASGKKIHAIPFWMWW